MQMYIHIYMIHIHTYILVSHIYNTIHKNGRILRGSTLPPTRRSARVFCTKQNLSWIAAHKNWRRALRITGLLWRGFGCVFCRGLGWISQTISDLRFFMILWGFSWMKPGLFAPKQVYLFWGQKGFLLASKEFQARDGCWVEANLFCCCSCWG